MGICLEREQSQIDFFSGEKQFSFMRAQHDPSYHGIHTPSKIMQRKGIWQIGNIHVSRVKIRAVLFDC